MSENKKEEGGTSKRSQMRRGLLEYCIFLAVSRGKVYSSDILETLKKADLIVVEGTLYPLLGRLSKQGLLSYAWQESEGGPPRKYYTLTEEGKNHLEDLHKEWKHLQTSIKNLSEDS